MKIHEYREMMRYLTRKPIPPMPAIPAEIPETSDERLAKDVEFLNNAQQGYAEGGRVNFQLGGIGRIIGKATRSEADYAKLADYIKNTYYINKDDPNLFSAIEKYSEKFGGNMSNTAESLGIDRKSMIQAAERRNYKLEGKGLTGTTKLANLDYGDLTVSNLVNEVQKDPKYLRNLIEQNKIDITDFYNSKELAKIFNVKEGKGHADDLITKFTREKGKTYEKGSWTNEPVEIINDPKKEQFKLYKLEDVINNIENYASQKAVKSSFSNPSGEIRKQIDPELNNVLNNFRAKRNLIIAHEGDEALKKALVKNPNPDLELRGNYYDFGHGFAVDHYDNFDFAKKNADKIYSLNRGVIQDPHINQTILVHLQGKEKDLFSNINKFFKENKGKKFDEEAIKKAEAINEEANNLFNIKQNEIKEFVNKRVKAEPYLEGQENTLSNIHIDIKPGKKISDTDVKVFGDIDPRHSFGNIQNINPKANKFSDLTKQQQEMFKQNMVDQSIDYSKNVLEQSKFTKGRINDFEESMLYGPTDTKEGFIGETGAPKFNKGGRVNLKTGSYPTYEETPLVMPDDIINRMITEETDPVKILALEHKLDMYKKKEAQIEKEKEAFKQSEKERGVRYKEDFPSSTDYHLTTAKQYFHPRGLAYAGANALKGVIEGTEWMGGQFGKSFLGLGETPDPSKGILENVLYHPVAGEKLGLNKLINYLEPDRPTKGMLDIGDVANFAGTFVGPGEISNMAKAGKKGIQSLGTKVMGEEIAPLMDPAKRDTLKIGAGIVAAPIIADFVKLKGTTKALRAAKLIPKVSGMPEWFPSLVAKIEKEGKYLGKDTGLVDNLRIKELTIQSKTEKGASEVYTMTEYPDGKIEIHANIKGGAYGQPFELHYTPPKTDIHVETGEPVKYPGDFSIVEQRPRPDPNDPGRWEFDWEDVSKEEAISDIDRVEQVTTGKIANQKAAQRRAAQRKNYDNTPYEDISNRYPDPDVPDYWEVE